MKTLVILSGHIASGKTSLAHGLERSGFSILKSRDLLSIELQDAFAGPDRSDLQKLGARLDQNHPGWLTPHAAKALQKRDLVVLDAVRRRAQVDTLREALQYEASIVHVHLEAPPAQLELRYHHRNDKDVPFSSAMADETEKQVDSLRETADLVVHTGRCTKEDTLVRALVRVGLRRNAHEKLVDVLVGAQYGSEGKGHVVSYIAPEYDVLVRTGGANAGHTVLHHGKPFAFKLLPSGTLHRKPGARVVLGPGMNIHLPTLLHEIDHCNLSPQDLSIDPQAWLVWDEDVEAEGGIQKGIGSTKQGVGAATARRITGRGTSDSRALQCPELRQYLRPALEVFDEAYQRGQRVLLEGTQGTGLSLYHGPYPYVTSRDTTASGTCSEAGIPPGRVNRVVLVTRTNPIRVASPEGGTSGPMRQELTWEEVSQRASVPADVLRERERTTTTKRLRRIAEFDWSLLHRAVTLNAPTDIALTFVDYVDHKNVDARRFEQLTADTLRFVEEVEQTAACPVSLITTRFHERSIIDRRAW